MNPQVPAAQDAVAFGGAVHVCPQAPQEDALVPTETSQPSAPRPLQSAKPAAQTATTQRPEKQPIAAWGPLHTVPQAPQLAPSVKALTSQPSAERPLQSAYPIAQEEVHDPALQPTVAWAPAVQTVPQTPQFDTSSWVFAQLPVAAQYIDSAGQVPTHTDPEQRVPALHVVPQAPQLALVFVTVSQPFAASPSQSPKPGLQATRRHAPAAH